ASRHPPLRGRERHGCAPRRTARPARTRHRRSRLCPVARADRARAVGGGAPPRPAHPRRQLPGRDGGVSRTVERVLVSGGGPAGMAAAIGFARRGVTVTFVEADPEWKAFGMGLTLLGPTLRALDSIGAADGCAAAGFAQDHADFHNAAGEVTGVVPFPAIADERLPPAICITRPAFHRAMSGITRDLDVDIRL